MSSTPPSGAFLFVEPLEARIAPAGLLGKANLVSDKPADPQQYLDYSVTPIPGVRLGFVDASAAPYNLNTTGVYALAMDGIGGADEVRIFNQTDGFGAGSIFLQANAGKLVAFFQDKNGDGQVQTNELVGLALGKKTSTVVNGVIDGDVVTNLSNNGSLLANGTLKLGYKINGLTARGINGSILSSGDINNVSVLGTVQNVLAGTATNGVPYHLGGASGPANGVLQGGAYKDANDGASVNNFQVVAFVTGGQIHAGDGGAGAFGGGVNMVRVLADTDIFTIQAGAGGVGDSTVRGGAGGTVSDVRISGVANSAVNHTVSILGGVGGANPEFKGGRGGAVTGVFTSFDTSDPTDINSGQQSADLLAQNFILHAGDGGAGLKAGSGGDVTDSNVVAATPYAGNAAVPEIQILGGAGGTNSLAGSGKGGNGGNVVRVNVSNLDTLTDALQSTILLQGGNAALGKNGGSVTDATLLGQTLVVDGGNGGNGVNKGGAGGSLNTIKIDNRTNLFTSSLTLNAGTGGTGGNGVGGAGGDIDAINMVDADLRAFTINSGTHGDGGTSANSKGGNGGSVRNSFFNSSNASGTFTAATARGGLGGDGLLGGGAGGDLANFTLAGTGFSANLRAANGGSVLANGDGDGGAGGNLLSVNVSNLPDLSNVTTATPGLAAQAVVVAAGSGGNGTGNGGAGGEVSSVNVAAGSSITLTSGNGGAGGSGVAGAGGVSTQSGANSLVGFVSLTTGNGGATGAMTGDGGLIDGFVASALGGIVMHAGNGGAGGAGGAITNSGTSPNLLTGLPNTASLDVHAGDGSAVGNHAGAGGDVSNFVGSVASGYTGANDAEITGVTTIRAGAGGGDATNAATKVGAGGSVSSLTLTGTNNALGVLHAQFVAVDAGQAGASAGAKKGAAGGGVNEAILYNLDFGTVVHHFAAGDGSAGFKKGADGGSISAVFVGTVGDQTADIGVRSGEHYGYANDQAGGLFAGVGGGGAKKSGVNGSVQNVTAAAISSIVAGKGAKPYLVEAIDEVKLAGNTQTIANQDGSYFNLATANVVGSVQNPNAANATTFKYDANGPIDGLVAVRTFPTNINFTPEAYVGPSQVDPTISLADYQQPKDAPVITTPAPNVYNA